MMKRLLLITAALLALTGAANAVELPELLARECWLMEARERTPGAGFVYTDAGGKCDFYIRKTEFGWRDHMTCSPIHVGEMKIKDPPRARTLEWTVRARCIGQITDGGRTDAISILKFKFNLFKGSELRIK
jgi:hypothetical protein